MHAGSREMVDVLLELGAEPGIATQQGATPLQLALRAGHDELAAHLVSLLDGPAALNAADVLKWTALHCAAQRISLPAVEMLLKVSCAVHLKLQDRELEAAFLKALPALPVCVKAVLHPCLASSPSAVSSVQAGPGTPALCSSDCPACCRPGQTSMLASWTV